MNEKFEKWIEGYEDACVERHVMAFDAWQAAIHSLEVTPEIVELACEVSFSSAGFNFHKASEDNQKMWTDVMYAALGAFLSALKEQPK